MDWIVALVGSVDPYSKMNPDPVTIKQKYRNSPLIKNVRGFKVLDVFSGWRLLLELGFPSKWLEKK